MEILMIGIYKITCLSTGKFYIGSSKNINTRWNGHVSDLNKNIHSNGHLQNAWNKHEKDNFKFEIIEEVETIEILEEREQWWLDETQCYKRNIGFNLSYVAGRIMSLEIQEAMNNKKKNLLDMAIKGENRPYKRKHKLGIALCRYTNPNNRCYDLEFTKQLTNLRPDWFITKSNLANIKKQKLLDIAKNGDKRPTKTKHPLGKVLIHYTSKNSSCYDPQFDAKIRKLRPNWFNK